ncbi:MAG: Inner membrane protein YbjJ [Paracidovorax wautersii]|uniref:Inner membrane protein YbjJ n=1 Tax=Paracidovorax wautersii TaxID=1177982 RepID=A0A7V8FKZ0_9BURK|nr:MAG: Inner membrane protein YbjJ [Paracidovorax wautersii]
MHTSEVRLHHRRRNALFTLFFLIGVVMSSWITRTPAIRDALGASIAEMGMVLFGLSVGSMSGILSAGFFVRRLGNRVVARIGMLLVVAGLLAMALGTAVQQAWVVAFGLGLIGVGMGLSEIAINIDGAHVERLLARPVLPALHGFFSLGTVCGAGVGLLLTSAAVAVNLHLAVVACLCLPVVLWCVGFIPDETVEAGRDAAPAQASGARSQAVWRDPRLLMIGFIVLAMAFAEGSANDWLPILMIDEHGFDPASGALVFLGFAAAMTLGRFCGGYFLARFGRAAVLRASAVSGVIGLSLVIFSTDPVLAGLAVLLWGLGASLGFPVALSAAGDSGPDPATRVRIAATAGYIAFLVGPPMLGFVGEHYGLRSAMLIVLAGVALAVFACSAAGQGHRRAGVPSV